MTKNILFVGHAASRSGAPMILLNLLRWLKARTDYRFDVNVLQAGPLLPDYRSIGRTEVLEVTPTISRRVLRKLAGAARLARSEDGAFARRLRARRYDLAYVNTVVPARQIRALAAAGVPVICHVHELDFAVTYLLGEAGLSDLQRHVTHFIAASSSVAAYLGSQWEIPNTKVSVIHEFTLSEAAPSDTAGARKRIRAELGYGDDNIVVGGCGTLDWRKGADLFVQAARLVATNPRGKRIRFVWIGADRTSHHYTMFAHDVRVAGLTDMITVVDSNSTPGDYFSAMDIFALTSREDPFPLVMLEAGLIGLPLVCFGSSGGGPEFAEGGAGIVVPYLDVAAFAESVMSLAADGDARRRIGSNARAKVEQRYTIDTQGPKILAVISRFARQ